MKEQVRAAVGMIVRPKGALLELPSDRFYLLAFVIFEYLIFETVRGDRWSFTLMGVGAVLSPIGALILKGIVRLFGKTLSLEKVANILGFGVFSHTGAHAARDESGSGRALFVSGTIRDFSHCPRASGNPDILLLGVFVDLGPGHFS